MVHPTNYAEKILELLKNVPECNECVKIRAIVTWLNNGC